MVNHKENREDNEEIGQERLGNKDINVEQESGPVSAWDHMSQYCSYRVSLKYKNVQD